MSAEQLEIVAPALVIGLLVALVHAPLGIEVLRRGIVFIDLAVAQIAGLSLVVVGLAWHHPSPLTVQATAIATAMAAAALFRWVEKAMPREQEAVIGSCFIVAASATLLALADHPHGGEEIQHILSGQILLASWQDIAVAGPLLIGVGAVWLLMPNARKGLGFFMLLALAVTASVQLVGVYVVFASLILPALAVNRLADAGRARRLAVAISAGAVVAGIALSSLLDLPAGPMLVGSFAAACVCARLAMVAGRTPG